MTIRPIQPQDNLQVAKVIRTVMTSYACVGDGFSITDPEVDHMYEAYNNDRSRFFVIADENNKIQGCAGIGPLVGGPTHTCELKKMYFYEVARGLGLGKKMMELCLTSARELGYSNCYLETVTRMERANDLYTKYGFLQLDEQVGGTGHSGCDTYYMRELLPHKGIDSND